MEIETKVIHAGQHPDEMTGAIMPPIYMSSTFVQKHPGEGCAFDYTRANNPNFEILERLLASLEHAEHATVFSSGLGALTGLICGNLKAGDRVIGMGGLYGGTYRLFTKIFDRFGIIFERSDEQNIEALLAHKPQWLLFETPSNPLLEIFDIEKLTALCKRYGVLSIVDNTFATPVNQNPLLLGADVVWHSTTKYIGGHSDVIGGVMMTNHAEIKEQLDFARKAVGVNPSPFDTWLVTRGVKTLAARMQLHEQNAMAIANYLAKHPAIKKIYYPGLESHSNHKVAKKQMRGFGGMISVEFNRTLEEIKELISKFQLFSLAESLGGVESLVCHPASMTHASIPSHERLKMGLADGLVRFSIGIESVDDLLHDLQGALQ